MLDALHATSTQRGIMQTRTRYRGGAHGSKRVVEARRENTPRAHAPLLSRVSDTAPCAPSALPVFARRSRLC